MADNELSAILSRRNKINEGELECPTENIVMTGSSEKEDEKSSTDAASDELAKKLNIRSAVNDGEMPAQNPSMKVFNVYTEFHEFTRKQIKDYEKMFKKYDIDNDNYINLPELKYMMEKLEEPQTHLGLKNMIKEVDEDNDGKISLREFLLIFQKASLGELQVDGLKKLANLSEIDVTAEGVSGAKNFFEAKVNKLTEGDKFEKEIKQEQEERRQLEVEKKKNREAFKAKAAVFK